MSRMGNYNLQLQEQAEEMGFSTVQEALDNGYHVVEDLVAGTATLKDLNEELAHEAWLKEKEELLEKLRQLKNLEEYSKELMGDEYLGFGKIEIMDRAIKFIEGVKYE